MPHHDFSPSPSICLTLICFHPVQAIFGKVIQTILSACLPTPSSVLLFPTFSYLPNCSAAYPIVHPSGRLSQAVFFRPANYSPSGRICQGSHLCPSNKSFGHSAIHWPPAVHLSVHLFVLLFITPSITSIRLTIPRTMCKNKNNYKRSLKIYFSLLSSFVEM